MLTLNIKVNQNMLDFMTKMIKKGLRIYLDVFETGCGGDPAVS